MNIIYILIGLPILAFQKIREWISRRNDANENYISFSDYGFFDSFFSIDTSGGDACGWDAGGYDCGDCGGGDAG